jgi:hypothetical protein
MLSMSSIFLLVGSVRSVRSVSAVGRVSHPALMIQFILVLVLVVVLVLELVYKYIKELITPPFCTCIPKYYRWPGTATLQIWNN